MGTINYRTSEFITIGVQPYDYSDFENDSDFMEYEREQIAEYGGTIEEYIYSEIEYNYEADRANVETILAKYDFHYFHVVIESGYYEGFYIDIENNYPICYDSAYDRREALKELTQLKRCLLECVDVGMCQVFPGWCTKYQSRPDSIKGIKDAIRQAKATVRATPTWTYCQRMGIEI